MRERNAGYESFCFGKHGSFGIYFLQRSFEAAFFLHVFELYFFFFNYAFTALFIVISILLSVVIFHLVIYFIEHMLF